MRRARQLIDEKLVARARLMGGLTESLRSLLPPALGSRCRVAGVTADQLTLAAESSAWATQLRYLQREIIKHMNAHHGLDVQRVKVHVSTLTLTNEEPADSRPGRRPRVPDAAADTLRRAARTVGDPGLAGALERLATKSGKRRS